MVVTATATYEDPMAFTTARPGRPVELHHALGHYPKREHGEDGEDATSPQPSPAVPLKGDGRSEAEERADRARLVR